MAAEELTLRARMESQRFVVGLIALIGVIAVVLEFFIEGDGGDLFVWLLAYGLGLGFWWLAGKFLAEPSASRINSLKPFFYAYVFCWILASVTTYVIWGEVDVITALAVLINLVGTYLMREFTVGGSILLKLSAASEGDMGTQSDDTH